MAGIDENRQMAEAMDGRHDAQVEGVASVVDERADSALAEDDLIIALGHDVFGGHEQLVEGGGHAALQQDGLAFAADGLDL